MSLFYKMGTAGMRMLPAERAHKTTIKALKAGLGPSAAKTPLPELVTEVGGLTLPNPVGLAAGFDKDCEVPDAMLACLLYTSPSPRDQRGSRMPSSA